MTISDSLSINEGFQIFLNECRAKNYAKHTIVFYENTIHNFSLYHDISEQLDTITKELVNSYIIYLEKKGIKDTTISTYIRGLRTILYYLMKEQLMDSFKISLPKVDEKIKETYSPFELVALLKKPDLKKCSFAEYRNWVLVNYLLATGQRLNTVVNLKIKDIDFDNEVIKLATTKGRRETLLPLSVTLKKILLQYLQFRKGSLDDYLFCSITGGQMSRGCITSAVKQHNKSRGVQRTSIHLFRHTFAKNYLMNGGDIFRLQKLMCHKEIETTKGYLNLTVKDLEKEYQKLNPLDAIGSNEQITMNRR